MFPKGKFNTDITRNAQYMILFRSPSDRKQIDIIAERIFAKDRPKFMEAYAKETAKPYGYVLIDNQPKTSVDKQVVSNVFGECQRYPTISANANTPREPVVTPVKRKVEFESPPTRKQKRQAKNPAKRQSKSAKIQPKAVKKQKRQTRQPAKAAKKSQPKKPVMFKPRYNVSPLREIIDDNSLSSDDAEMSASLEYDDHYTDEQLNALATQYRPRNGFVPRFVY